VGPGVVDDRRHGLLTALSDATDTAYATAMTAQRDKAQLVLSDWQEEMTRIGAS